MLTDVDLSAMRNFHRERGSGSRRILLTRVDDPRRYGLVEIADDGARERVRRKAGGRVRRAGARCADQRRRLPARSRGARPIPAGPAGCRSSAACSRSSPPPGGLYAFVADGYWRDIGTPESYLQAHFDLLQSKLVTSVSGDVGASYLFVAPDAVVAPGARVVPPAHVGGGTTLAAGSRVGPLAVIGAGCTVGAGADIAESVVQDGVTVGARATSAQRRRQRRLAGRRTATS